MNIGRDPAHEARRRAAMHQHNGIASPPDEGEQYSEDVFWYNLNFGSNANPQVIAPGDSYVQTLQIASDEPFKCTKLTGFGYVSGANPIVRNTTELTLTIQDGSNGRFLTYSALPFDTIIGSAQLPYILPIPRIFKARGLITVTVTNSSTAGETNNTYTAVEITFGGTKLFKADDANDMTKHFRRRSR